MQIWTGLESFRPDPLRPLILGIGNFDGLHSGHQALIGYVIGRAGELNGTCGILTFRNHPQHILHPQDKPLLLMTSEYKLFLLQEMGIEICFYLPFTAEFSETEAEAFVENILVRHLKVREVCMGFNAHFGHNRRGDARLMRELAPRLKFHFKEIEPVKTADDFVSSSRIRGLVKTGRLREAEACLGRPFSVWGRVVAGEKRGKGLGFPTANLEIQSDILPPEGVYPVMLRTLGLEKKLSGHKDCEELIVRERGSWFQGVMNYGFRPTFQPDRALQKSVPEVFLFNFEGDLYGRTAEVAIYPRLREEKRFENADLLKKQIKEDIDRAREFFARLPNKAFTKKGD